MKRSSPNEEEKEKLMAAFKAFKEAKKRVVQIHKPQSKQ